MTKGITRKMVHDRLKKFEISIEDLDKTALIEFKEEMKKLSDSRQKAKKVYKIWDIVVVAFLAILGNCNVWEEIHDFTQARNAYFKNFLILSSGFPSAITYKNIKIFFNY